MWTRRRVIQATLFAAAAAVLPARLFGREPTPSVLDRYRGLFERIVPGDDWELNGYLSPKSAGLVLIGAPGENPIARLRDYLRRHREVVDGALTLAPEPMEPIPESPPLNDEDPDAHMRHPTAWIVNVARLVSSDAHRAWDDNDFEGTAERMIAVWHIAASGVRNPGQRVTIVLAMNVPFTEALLDAGLASKITPATTDRWLSAVRRIDPEDPFGSLATWQFEAERAVVTLKQELGGRDAGERLAEYFENWGIVESGLDTPDAARPDIQDINILLRLTVPFKDKAVLARTLTAAQIAHRLDEAALLIPDLDRAVRAEDPTGAMRPVLERISKDPTHIARRVFGGIGMAVPLTLSTRETIAKIVKRLERRVP